MDEIVRPDIPGWSVLTLIVDPYRSGQFYISESVTVY